MSKTGSHTLLQYTQCYIFATRYTILCWFPYLLTDWSSISSRLNSRLSISSYSWLSSIDVFLDDRKDSRFLPSSSSLSPSLSLLSSSVDKISDDDRTLCQRVLTGGQACGSSYLFWRLKTCWHSSLYLSCASIWENLVPRANMRLFTLTAAISNMAHNMR